MQVTLCKQREAVALDLVDFGGLCFPVESMINDKWCRVLRHAEVHTCGDPTYIHVEIKSCRVLIYNRGGHSKKERYR